MPAHSPAQRCVCRKTVNDGAPYPPVLGDRDHVPDKSLAGSVQSVYATCRRPHGTCVCRRRYALPQPALFSMLCSADPPTYWFCELPNKPGYQDGGGLEREVRLGKGRGMACTPAAEEVVAGWSICLSAVLHVSPFFAPLQRIEQSPSNERSVILCLVLLLRLASRGTASRSMAWPMETERHKGVPFKFPQVPARPIESS
ncbi:hypothetical protein GQ53DRAFT_514126 [Thozetella sp. PMI_491]|nr:hypothetical protein GQ53DRAFT_514126 [Thozetella sp. PMI_491]